MEYKATAVIQSEPDKIWKVLTDVSAWPSWDPFCERVEGKLALGNKLKVFTKLSPGRGFPVKVVELTPNQRMTWSGGMPFGLFKGVRTYTLNKVGTGSVTFTTHEVFSGPLAPLIGRTIPDLTDAFNQFVLGLKNRVEGQK